MALIWRRNEGMCAMPIFQQAAAQRVAGRAHRALCKLLHLVAPVQAAARAAHASPAAQCWAVLSLSELLAGFLLPTLELAAQESRCFAEWHAHWQRAWQLELQQRRRWQSQLFAAGTSSAATQLAGGPGASDAAEMAAAGCSMLPPHVKPPGGLAVCAYQALHASLRLQDPSDWVLAGILSTFTVLSAWHAILLATPEGLA